MSDLPPAVPDVTVPSTEPSAPAAPAPVVEESAPQPAAAPTTESEASVPEPVVGDKRPAPEDEEEEQTKIQDKVDEPINVVPVDDKAIEAETATNGSNPAETAEAPAPLPEELQTEFDAEKPIAQEEDVAEKPAPAKKAKKEKEAAPPLRARSTRSTRNTASLAEVDGDEEE